MWLRAHEEIAPWAWVTGARENMKGKWLRMMASAFALAGAALAGCGQSGDQRLEYPIVQPTQPDRALTAAPVQQDVPASAAPLEPAQAPGALSTEAEATATLTPETPAWTGETMPDSNERVEKAKADLAIKLGIPANEIDSVVVIGQEFTPDGFYCRSSKSRSSKEEPTVMIIGETILLKAQGNRYEYHADGQEVIFCRQLP
jgi:hypothetical protein